MHIFKLITTFFFQTKLQLIEYVMGTKSLKELIEKCPKSVSDIQSSTLLPTNCTELLTQNHHNPGMEAIRRLAQVQLSPIKTVSYNYSHLKFPF